MAQNNKPKRKPARSKRSKSWEDRESRDMKRDYKKDQMDRESTNDPNWYATDAALLRDSASFPFSQPLGEPVVLHTNYSHTMPGVCALHLTPSVGYAADSTSAINVAAKSIYSFIRHANSGAKVYDAPDLMIYMIAMANVYAAINWAQRLYGLAYLYIQRNRYLPEALFKAENVDMMSVVNNLSSFRFRLNVLINKVASMAVPANMTVFQRIAFLYTNIYSEGPSVKDQIYFYVPDGFYKFQINSSTSAGELVFDDPKTHAAVATAMEWNEVLGYIESLMNAIWDEEDFGIMSGDILKAYGDNIIKLSSLPEIYPLQPIYDPMVLTQMKNTTIMTVDTSTVKIAQDATKAYLVSMISYPTASATTYSMLGSASKILSIEHEAPTPEMVIEASRLMVSIMHASSGGVGYYSCGTEICTNAETISMNSVGVFTSRNCLGTFAESWGGATAKPYLLNWFAFKYMPAIYFTDSNGNVTETLFEVDNFTVLDANNIDKLHTAAVLNMLNVPSIAKNAIGR